MFGYYGVKWVFGLKVSYRLLFGKLLNVIYGENLFGVEILDIVSNFECFVGSL